MSGADELFEAAPTDAAANTMAPPATADSLFEATPSADALFDSAPSESPAAPPKRLKLPFEAPTGFELQPSLEAVPAGADFVSPMPGGYLQPQAPEESEADAKLRLALAAARDSGLTQERKVLGLAQALGVESSVVRPNVAAWERAAAEANAPDIAEWRKANPDLARMADRSPDMAPVVVERDVSLLVRAFRKLRDMSMEGGAEAAFARAVAEGTPEEAVKVAQGLQADREARAKRKQVVATEELDDAQARAVRDSWARGLLTPVERLKEGIAGLRVAELGAKLAWQRDLGEDDTQTLLELHDAQLEARPRYYGETAFPGGEAASDAATLLPSTATAVLQAGRRGGVGALVGGGVGFLVGGPAGAVAGFEAGVSAGALFGAAEKTFELEKGTSYLQMLETKTADGRTLTHPEASGASTIYGILATGIELVELKLLKEAFGLGGGAGAEGLEAVKGLLANSPQFRAMAARAAAKAAVGESVEESAQELTQQLVTSAAKDEWLYGTPTGERPFKAPDVDVTDVVGAGTQAFAGSLLLGAGGLAFNLATHSIGAQKSVRGEAQTRALFALAGNETVAAAPAEFARMVEEVTRESGAPATHLYVDARAVGRYYQTKGLEEEEAKADLESVAGPGASENLAVALQEEGGKLAVPVEAVLSTWGNSDIGKALVKDSTLQVGIDTPNELAAKGGLEGVAENARKIAEAELAAAGEETRVRGAFDNIEEELRASGRDAVEAKAAVGVFRRFEAALRARGGAAAASVLDAARVTLLGEAVPEASKALTDSFRGRKLAQPEVAKAAEDEYLLSPTTGALGRRAWKLREATLFGPKAVTFFAVEGLKAANSGWGQAGGDVLLQHAAAVLQRLLPGREVYEVGGNFVVPELSEEEFAKVLAEKAQTLGGARFWGAQGTSLKEAADAAEKVMTAAEGEGKKTKREAFKFEAGYSLAESPGHVVVEAPQDLRDAFWETPEHQAFMDIYVEPVTGLLTKEGRDAYLKLHPKNFFAMADVNLLKAFNKLLGHEGGDALLQGIGIVIRAASGGEFTATHISGDEYSFHHNDKAKLESFLTHLRRVSEGVTISLDVERESGALESHDVHGFSFGVGVGLNEKEANEQLKADKQRLSEAGKRGDTFDASLAIAQNVVHRRAPRVAEAGAGNKVSVGVRDSTGRDVYTGASQTWAAPIEAASSLAERHDAGANRGGDGQALVRPPSKSTHDAEQMAGAREAVGRLRDAAKKARLGAFLDFVSGWETGALRPLEPLTRAEELDIARFGIVDPEYGWTTSDEFGNTHAKKPKTLSDRKRSGPAQTPNERSIRAAKREEMMVRFGRQVSNKALRQEAVALNGAMTPEEVKALEAGPLWHSAAEAAVTQAKQEKNTPAAWLALVTKTPGVRAEELEWTGLKTWLAKQKGSLTRAQVLEYLQANRLQVREEGAAPASADFSVHQRVARLAFLDGKDALMAKIGNDWGSSHTAKLENALAKADAAMRAVESSDFVAAEKQMTQATRLWVGWARLYTIVNSLKTGNVVAGDVLVRARQLYEANKGALRRDFWKGANETTRNRISGSEETARLMVQALESGDVAMAAGAATRLRDEEVFVRDSGEPVVWKELLALVKDARSMKQEKPQYQDYSLGGEVPGTYREARFYLPGQPSGTFKSSHFDEGGWGLVAHARLSVHLLAGGEKTLLAEELQSDLHQVAREKGYERRKQRQDLDAFDKAETRALDARKEFWLVASRMGVPYNQTTDVAFDVEAGRTKPEDLRFGGLTDEQNAKVREEAAKLLAAREAFQNERRKTRPEPRVPDAPLKTTWEEFLAKRLVRYAADNGLSSISWVPGQVQADRYKLSQHVEALYWHPETHTLTGINRDGLVAFSEEVPQAKLPEYIGTDATKRLLATEVTTEATSKGASYEGVHALTGESLSVGGEGMTQAYDVRLPAVMKRLVAKDGGSVGKATLENGQEVWKATLPVPLLKRARLSGMPLFQDKEERVLGATDIPTAVSLEQVYRIFLSPQADRSTVFHEAGHVFLDLLRKVAESPDAPATVREDYAAALEYLGAKPGQALETEHHEKWARSWEAWLREGKAPAPSLVRIFTRFKLWLTALYRDTTQLKVQLTPEIRGVFSRLLVTEEEASKFREALGPPQFETAEAAGMSPDDFAKANQLEAEETAYATRRAELYALKETLRETEAWWKEERAQHVEKGEEAYDALPEVKAKAFLENGPLGDGPVTLRREEVEAVVGKTRKVVQAKEGASLAEVADMVRGDDGKRLFASGEEMLLAVVQLADKDEWVKRYADGVMAELHPTVLVERTKLRALVADGLHQVAEKRVLREYAQVGARAPKGNRPSAAELKGAAAIIAGKRKVTALRVQAALQASGAAAKKAAVAGVRGQWVAAAEAKGQQLLQLYLHKALVAAQEARDATLELASALGKPKARERAGKVSPLLRDGIDAILEGLGFVGEGPRQLGVGDVLAAVRYLEDSGAGAVGDWVEKLPAIFDKAEWQSLTVDELKVADSALRQLRAVVRQEGSALLGKKKAQKDAVVSSILSEISNNLRRKPPPGTKSAEPLKRKVGRIYNALEGFLLAPADMLADLLGARDTESVTWQAILQPLLEAKYLEADILKSLIGPIITAFEKVPAEVRARFSEDIDGEALFPNHTQAAEVPRRRFELLVMALNSGNEGNLQRLTDGRGITREQVFAALDLLTPAEVQWVQSVLDVVESLRGPAFDLEERVTGVRPQAVEASPVQLKGGLLRGGYFPAVYQRGASQVGDRQSIQAVADLMDSRYVRPGTSHGHLKARAESVTEAAISLDPDVIYRHLAQVAHDIAFREAVQSVGRIILDKRVDAELKRRLGVEKTELLRQWVADVGKMRTGAGGAWLKFVQGVRSHLGTAILGYKLSVAIGDLANIPAAVAQTELKTKHLAAALAEATAAPLETWKACLEKSGQLRSMEDSARRDLQRHMKSLTSKARASNALRPYFWLKDNAFAFMEMSQALTTTPVWLGAYRQALADGKAEDVAVRFADDVVQQVFPSHSAVNQSAILRDKGFMGLSTLFYGYMNVAFRGYHNILRPLLGADFRESGAIGKAKIAARVAGGLVAFSAAYAVFGEFMMGRGPEDDDRDEDEPDNAALKWRNWFLRKLLLAFPATLPFEFANLIESKALHRQTNPRATPLNSLIDTVVKGVGALGLLVTEGDEEAAKKLKAALNAAGVLLGFPTAPLGTALEVGAAVNEGDISTPVEAASGAVYGVKKGKPLNPISVFGEESSQ